MLLGLVSRVYRDRRRLIFVASLAFLAGFFMYLRADLYLGGWHIAWVTGAIYACVVGLVALCVCLFLPRMRFMIEAVAISRLCLSLAVLAWPGMGALLLSDPFITASVIVLGGILVSRCLHGRIVRVRTASILMREPARLIAGPLQMRFTGWIDNAVPVRA